MSWLDALVPAAYPNNAALARAFGVSGSTVTRWRGGAVPQARALRAIASATGTDVSLLYKIAGRREREDGAS